ncbi:MAG: GNAT family N-acetyltransferase, partial [Microbacterium sp.]
MNFIDARTIPVDPRSESRLRDSHLDYRVVDVTDAAAADAFSRADARGFLEAEPDEERHAQLRQTLRDRRNIGVYEPHASAEALPIATVSSWIAPLTVPGGEIPMWAISAVTVAATYRRRGIARNLLEGELRAAVAAGTPIAGLVVSEATIYGRYGFAPAIPVARVVIDSRRAGWMGADAPGRLQYIDRPVIAEEMGAVHERSRKQRVGQIPGWEGRWQGTAGLAAGDPKGASVRGVRYLDTTGATRGVIAYTLQEAPGSFRSVLKIRHLAAESDEALRALWGFAVNHDLVDRVEADLRPVDDPILHLVADQRAVEFTVHDHG